MKTKVMHPSDFSYVIGSGYADSKRYDAVSFARYWLGHILYNSCPWHIYLLTHDGHPPPAAREYRRWRDIDPIKGPQLTVIPSGNLGHIHQLIKKEQPFKDHFLGGWSASILALAMLAYNAERDFIYVEQDCLIFNGIIGAIYDEANERNKDMLFGSCAIMDAAQSLFFVRHRFIPFFVRDYLMGYADTDPTSRPEKKFVALEKSLPAKVGRFSFGLDRDRPLMGRTSEPWYAQQITDQEMETLKAAGVLIPFSP